MNEITILCSKCGRDLHVELKNTVEARRIANPNGVVSAFGSGLICIAITPCAHCSSPETKALELLYETINAFKSKPQ